MTSSDGHTVSNDWPHEGSPPLQIRSEKIGSTMHALTYSAFGPPDVLEWTDHWPPPTVTPTGVLIHCHAGGVNPKDVLLRKGKFSRWLAREPLPRVVGLEAAGDVIAVGEAVTDFHVGDRVFGMTNRFSGGLHANIACLDRTELAIAPANISTTEAAAIPLAALTALQSLRNLARLSPGQCVLINGASGGVGHFAVQIAKCLDAEVVAVCGPAHLDFVASLGADAVLDYQVTPAPELDRPFDVVFDVFGRYTRRDFARQLGTRGIFVSTVPTAWTLLGELRARLGLGARSRLVVVRSTSTDLDQLRRWTESGQIRPHVEKVFPATHAADAHRHIETRHTTGKVVIALDV